MKPIMIATGLVPLCLIAFCFAVPAMVSLHENEIMMNVLTDKGVLSEFSSQTRQERPRPRIRVQRDQPTAWDYPRPDDYSWPGPGAVRQCVDWYATEYRPSGTVVTPQMRCRWVRG